MAKANKRAKARAKAKPKKPSGKRAKAARAATKRARWPGQIFTVSHPREEDFDKGLRAYAKYRDLGIAAATCGAVQAHVIRFTPPFRPEDVSTPHYHDVDFQMIYVLKGWYRSEFEGHGAITMTAGACWIQPPRIKHTVLGYSDDCELLEIVLPANFATVTLA